MKLALVFFILYLTMAINLPDSYIAHLGVDPNYLMIALIAIVIAGLVTHRHIALITLVILLSFGANLPEEFLISIGMDKDILFATLVVIVFVPLSAKLIE